MYITEGYSLYQLQGVYYLLPYGQNITLFKPGLKLNCTGALLWRALNQGLTKPELLPYLAKHYNSAQADYPALQTDIDQFLELLAYHRLISDTALPESCTCYLRIGGLNIGYYGPEELLHPNFKDFVCEAHISQQRWIIMDTTPEPVIRGELIIKTPELTILKDRYNYIINLSDTSQLSQILLSQDGSIARFYCTLPFHERLTEQLFHAARHAYLFIAQKMGGFVLHSSSVLYKNHAWLFSAPSGTGKSTMAAYWKQLFDTPILNGDLNLIRFSGDTPVVLGLPWCGTSQLYFPGTYPLGGIVLLKQGNQNTIHRLSLEEQQLSVSARLISPAWTGEHLSDNLQFSGDLLHKIPIFQYRFRKEENAARELMSYIDQLS